MAKRARPIVPPSADLFDVVHQIPWDAPHVGVDDVGRWWARFERLRQRAAFTKVCAETARAASIGVAATDWATAPGAEVVAIAEALGFAHAAASRFLAFLLDLDARQRRQLYAGGWLLHCWERAARPEPILALLVYAFEGGPSALVELARRCQAHPGSFAVGAVRLLQEVGDQAALDEVLRTIRKLAWRRVPSRLRTFAGTRQDERDAKFWDLCAELDAATWTVLEERLGALDATQALVLGLDDHLWTLPGVIGNRLRTRRLLSPAAPVADIVVEIDPHPQAADDADDVGGLLDDIESGLTADAPLGPASRRRRPPSEAVSRYLTRLR